jgi:Ni/Fe-hydrogenase subunit HybB-like protein
MSTSVEHPHKAGEYQPPSPVLTGTHTYDAVTGKITDLILYDPRKSPKGWFFGLMVAATLLGIMLMTVTWLLLNGIGIWGNNIPVGWAFDIINFVWWIGIGHAGTLISAILLLFKQEWRTSINRAAEAMTIFAVACAGLFPLLHTGRPWWAYWLMPYPNPHGLWPQFRSPLVWDVFAVSTYGTVSLLFWIVGLIPDFASMRDRATNVWLKRLFGFISLGWRGSAVHWHRYDVAYLILAGLSTPLVLSVHTVVSFDFATSIIPGWHATIFPPYFVAGAIYAGFAMVLTLMIPVRAAYKLHDFITDRHMQNMAKVMLVSGLVVAYGYFTELFFSWYSGNYWEKYMFLNRTLGPYWWAYALLILCNILVPQGLWISRFRSNPYILFTISMFINVGMWLERFVIIVVSLHRDFLPSSWAMYSPTRWDFGMLFGSIGLFLFLFFLFIRFLPVISIFEMRTLLPESKVKEHH